MKFLSDFENELTSLGVIIYPPYEGENLLGLILKQIHCSKECTAEEFARYVHNRAKVLRFIPLKLPKNVSIAQLHRHNNIYIRYIETTMPHSDDIMERWDVLINKVD